MKYLVTIQLLQIIFPDISNIVYDQYFYSLIYIDAEHYKM